ncbi:hypothetical protein AVEN_261227-1 [Araneus ventricosus]|uniref:Uncharacterized protein n=1 Tax=Araneus ventricosus TaxID=182803 RepID=A0A4Y2GJP5_ARAVE|nr:hypothetical protein AVEN_261227-1 [Araneus ventricosus]
MEVRDVPNCTHIFGSSYYDDRCGQITQDRDAYELPPFRIGRKRGGPQCSLLRHSKAARLQLVFTEIVESSGGENKSVLLRSSFPCFQLCLSEIMALKYRGFKRFLRIKLCRRFE